jgi:hypothetical protein
MGWQQRREQLAELVDAAPAEDDDHAAAARVLVAMAESFEPERERILLRARALRSSPALRGRNADTTAAWEHTLADGLARRRGLPEPDVRARAVAAAYTAVWRTALGEWLRSARHSLPATVAQAFDHLRS